MYVQALDRENKGFQGWLDSNNQSISADDFKILNKRNTLWMSKELHDFFRMSATDYVTLGKKEFEISKIVSFDPTILVENFGYSSKVVAVWIIWKDLIFFQKKAY